MIGNEFLQQISKHLFWDVNVQDLDAEKHRRYIIVRVMDRGSREDVRLVWDHYGEETIRTELLNAPACERKTIFYFANQFGVKPEAFRAFRKKKELGIWAL